MNAKQKAIDCVVFDLQRKAESIHVSHKTLVGFWSIGVNANKTGVIFQAGCNDTKEDTDPPIRIVLTGEQVDEVINHLQQAKKYIRNEE